MSKEREVCSSYQLQTGTNSISCPSQEFLSTPFLDSPDLVFDKPESRNKVFKSLPALDNNYDQLDKELQQLSDSLGVLYEQEDSEIEFLDSFIDYDDISIIYKTVEDKGKREAVTGGDESEIIVVTDRNEEATREIIIDGSETKQKAPRRSLRERLTWLKSRGKLVVRSLGCNNCIGRRFSKPESKYEVRTERRKEESGSDSSEAEEQKDLIRVKSYHITQDQVTIKNIEPQIHDRNEYNKAVTELENLEKLILRDSLRETFLKQRGMETIREEAELSFNNLSYGMVKVGERGPEDYYENVKPEKSLQNLYENVPFSEPHQYYENCPPPRPALQGSGDDEYESYDFGEEGIYQNVMFNNGSASVKCSDVNTEVDTLQKRINEVNDIIKIDSPKIPPEKVYKSKLLVTLSKPTTSAKEGKGEPKPVANKPPQKPLRSISNNFKTWALSKAEHPKIDVDKLSRQKLVNNTEMFSQEERNVVKDFLISCKEEFKSS